MRRLWSHVGPVPETTTTAGADDKLADEKSANPQIMKSEENFPMGKLALLPGVSSRRQAGWYI